MRAAGPMHWHEPTGMWLALSYEHCNVVLRDRRLGRLWSGRRPADRFEPFNLLHRNQMTGNEPPDHTRLRSLVAGAFNRGAVTLSFCRDLSALPGSPGPTCRGPSWSASARRASSPTRASGCFLIRSSAAKVRTTSTTTGAPTSAPTKQRAFTMCRCPSIRPSPQAELPPQ